MIDLSFRIHRRALGSTHPHTATDLSNRGEILVAMNDLPNALKSYQEANAIWEREFGSTSPALAFGLTGVGVTLVGLGRPVEAIAPLEHALEIRRKHDPDGSRLGETEFALARAIWDSRRDGVRSSSLAQKALRDYGQLPSFVAQRAQIAEWLSHHDRASKRQIVSR
jgi:tetratricopeptide (TPR) repeat protein